MKNCEALDEIPSMEIKPVLPKFLHETQIGGSLGNGKATV